MLYFGNQGGQLYLRNAAPPAAANQLVNYPGVAPVDIVLNPSDWRIAYVIDTNKQVWRTTDAGANWGNVTGNLGTIGAGVLRSIEFLPMIAYDALLVGADAGVFLTRADAPGAWAELGSNLPNAPAFDLRYDSADEVLLVATLGRGAWIIQNARSLLQPGSPSVGGSLGILDAAPPLREAGASPGESVAPLAAAAVGVVVTLGASAWYARRRWPH